MQKLIIAAAVTLAFPALARAGEVAMVVRDVPAGARTLAASSPAPHFNMLAMHWRGPGSVLYRTRGLHGGWRAWRAVDDDVHPDERSPEAAQRGVRQGNLDWAGASDAAQFRTRGAVRGLRAFYLWSRVKGAATRRLTLAGSPAIVARADWQADEKIKRAKPLYAPRIKLSVVHHTAGTNTYSKAQAAAIVRGIEVYHVKGNGWNDIGYNFLVDRFGTVYEGRYGGEERNVIGAHAEGFNTGTVGVALIGNYTNATPPQAQRDALVKVLAWRLDVAHVDPFSTVVYTSGGNAKYRAGKVVTLRAVSGHRDTGPSECPGRVAYAGLPQIAASVANTGLPKLYAPVVSGALGGRIRFQARLSSTLPWTVTVTDALGVVVATGKGRGATIDWAWNPLLSAKSGYTWTIDAGPTVRPASGTLGVVAGASTSLPAPPAPPAPPAGPLLTAFAVSPAVIAPDAAGILAPAVITYALSGAAQVKAQLLDEFGSPLLTVFDARRLAGPSSASVVTDALSDGRYTLSLTVSAKGAKTQTKTGRFVVDRTFGGFTATPAAFSPNGDGVLDVATFSFSLARAVPVRLTIGRAGTTVATPFQGILEAGPHVLSWDGANAGVRIADGAYAASLTVTGGLGDVSATLPVALDTTPPALALLDLATLRFQLSEPAMLTLVVNGSSRFQRAVSQGTFTVPFLGGVASLSAQAFDGAGNSSAIVKSP